MRTRIVTLLAAVAVAGQVTSAQSRATTPEVTVKAAYLYNFAKFTDWQTLDPGAPVTLCIVGDPKVAAALVTTVRGQSVAGHTVAVEAVSGAVPVRACHLLFISTSATRASAGMLGSVRGLPVLTVSDDRDFARKAGIIELFVDEAGRMRFAINTDAVARSGLHLSSRLLGLAQIVRDINAH